VSAWLIPFCPHLAVSMHSKGRIAFGNNMSVLKCLCRILRSTCEDGEQSRGSGSTPASELQKTPNMGEIQFWSAIAMCNSLSIYFKRTDIEEMARLGIVNDVAVIMMLRVNEVGSMLRYAMRKLDI
jgi:hypothetical protein